MTATFLGTLPGWLTVIAVVVLGWSMRGGAIGPAIGYLREANAALQREVIELKRRNTELARENVTLQARTNLEPMQLAVIDAIDKHELASGKRDESVLAVLDLIAQRLGPNGSV